MNIDKTQAFCYNFRMTSSESIIPDDQPDMPPDPFSPKKVYLNTPGGLALNAIATAEQYGNPSIPQIETGSLKIGDRLHIEIEGQEPQEYAIECRTVPSMSFGSDDVNMPKLDMMLANGERAGDRVQFVGSSISPSGTLLTPGSIKMGTYLNTVSPDGIEVSGGVITGFSVKRRAEDGRYIEVPLNHEDAKPSESQSFADFEHDYKELVDILSGNGFDFSNLDENGFSATYRKFSDDHTIVYASNQGFGCGILPQHEAYMYNADTERLVGMRYLPTKRIAQMVVMQGVTPELYAQETFAYNMVGELDWRQLRSIEPSSLHRMSSRVPFVTYTWLDSSVEKPAITVKANVALEGMQRLQGTADYEITIAQGEDQLLSAAQPGWWVEDPEQYKAIEVNNTTLSDSEQSYDLSFADLSIRLLKDPSALRAELIEAFRRG